MTTKSKLPRPLLVGMNNPIRPTDPRYALWPDPVGSSGHRLWSMLHERTGATKRQYLRAFERVNMLQSRSWNDVAARAAAGDVLRRAAGRAHVIVLGAAVRSALGAPRDTAYFVPTQIGGATVIVLPHPSGLNRLYNDASNRDAAARVIAAAYAFSRSYCAWPVTNPLDHEIPITYNGG